jgi:hypothetical protein
MVRLKWVRRTINYTGQGRNRKVKVNAALTIVPIHEGHKPLYDL